MAAKGRSPWGAGGLILAFTLAVAPGLAALGTPHPKPRKARHTRDWNAVP